MAIQITATNTYLIKSIIVTALIFLGIIIHKDKNKLKKVIKYSLLVIGIFLFCYFTFQFLERILNDISYLKTIIEIIRNKT